MRINSEKLDIALAKNIICKVKALEQAGLSRGTISRIKRRQELRPTTVGRIAKQLNVAVEDLIDTEDTASSAGE